MVERNKVSILSAARAGDQEAFRLLTDSYRYELRVHCYRMLGSLQDAEDMVQETMLRAWRRLETFQERASIRAWLYKIATNVCLDAMDKQKRVLPQAIYPPSTEQEAVPDIENVWLQPCPDDWFNELSTSPEARYTTHESMSLAFLVALQLLPARQRAVLILSDVLDWRASEAAELLDTTVSSVNNLLRRARVTLQERANSSLVNPLPPNESLRAVLDRYVRAWETEDVSTLVSMLKEDAVMSMPPAITWFRGNAVIGDFIKRQIFPFMGASRWLFRPVVANGLPAFAVYEPDAAGKHCQAHSIHVLRFDGLKLAEITVFYSPELFKFFGLPAQLDAG